MMLRLLALSCAAAVLAACSGSGRACTDGDAACTRVLFIGNSYTSTNDLPSVFAKLAASAGHRVKAEMVAPGGASLADHAASPRTAAALASARWDYVVLQEQSAIPASASARQSQMYPAARLLIGRAQRAGATPVLFLTWAHRDGWPEARLASYGAMQSAIDGAYAALAREQNVAVAPAGDAWAALADDLGAPALWQTDGSHPTSAGTYLAACVFYATIFQTSPAGLAYHGDLATEDAARLQAAAARAVLGGALATGER
jgi:hypothetical protein